MDSIVYNMPGLLMVSNAHSNVYEKKNNIIITLSLGFWEHGKIGKYFKGISEES